jgi:hypothetical protein
MEQSFQVSVRFIVKPVGSRKNVLNRNTLQCRTTSDV